MTAIASRSDIINASIPLLAIGQSTDEIATQFGIVGRTLRLWLINDDRATEARKTFLASKLSECVENIEAATETLPLARAREAFKSWSWIAERRLPEHFGAKQDVGGLNVSVQIVAFAPQSMHPNGALDSTGVMSSSDDRQSVAHQRHIAALASLTPEQLDQLKLAIEKERGRSPVAPGVDDLRVDQSVPSGCSGDLESGS